jgi:hypothetical protein
VSTMIAISAASGDAAQFWVASTQPECTLRRGKARQPW